MRNELLTGNAVSVHLTINTWQFCIFQLSVPKVQEECSLKERISDNCSNEKHDLYRWKIDETAQTF